MAGTKDLNRVVERIYRSALDASNWPAALTAVASLLGSSGAMLMVVDPRSGVLRSIVAGGFDDVFVRRYAAEIAPHDPWLRVLITRPGRTILSAEALATERHDKDTPRVGDFLRAHKSGHIIGAVLSESDADKTVIAVHRSYRVGPHDSADIDLFEAVLPHLRNTIGLARRSGEARSRAASLEQLLDRLPIGVFLVDTHMQVLLANRFGRELAAERDGLTIRNGRLCALDAAQDAQLEQLVKQTASLAPGQGPAPNAALGLSRPDRAHALHVLGLPVGPAADGGLGPGLPAAAVLVGDPDKGYSASEGVIGAFFGLTGAEARLTSALISGLRVREVAETLGVSELTIRTQLKRILQKTGASRQSELVRFLLTGPSLFTFRVNQGSEE